MEEKKNLDKQEEYIIKIHKTLVGFFDIYAYSKFIGTRTMDECISRIEKLFNVIEKDAGSYSLNLKVRKWILSDSIIVTPDLTDLPENRLTIDSIDFFLMICAILLYRGIKNELPLRGAIGGGFFYKKGEVMASSALVNAHDFEVAQGWFGATITPDACDIINEVDQTFLYEFDRVDNRFNSHRFLRRGNIPWKEKKDLSPKMEKELSIKNAGDYFYIIPPQSFEKDWTEYLPTYLDKSNEKLKKMIEESHRIYRVG